MDSLLKSEKALDILTTITLAQFLIIAAIIIGIAVFLYKFRDNIKNVFEDYRERENRKEEYVAMINDHEAQITELKQHHEEDMRDSYNKQLKYREQSLEKQAQIDCKFQDINEKIDALMQLVKEQHEETKRLKCNELREKLLTSYSYFTSIETNPSQSWNEMESEAFWHLFNDYEEMGGNGFMHEKVKPAMEMLNVIRISDL